MKLHKFTGCNINDALEQAQLALGEDALFFSQRQTNHGVEITASRQNDYQAIQNNYRAHPAIQHTLESLTRDIQQISAMLQQAIATKPKEKKPRLNSQAAHCIDHLQMAGFSKPLCYELCDYLGKNHIPAAEVVPTLQNLLPKMLAVCDEDRIQAGGIISLLGLTGSGKTTTVAKLAARYIEYYDPQNMAIISTDTYRVGAKEQLQAYTKILNIKTYFVTNQEEFNCLLARLNHLKLILVDNASLSQHTWGNPQRKALLQTILTSTECFITLAANTQMVSLDHLLAEHGIQQYQGCIITKTDEVSTLGTIISWLITKQTPIAYHCFGQHVPRDITLPNAKQLVASCLAPLQTSQYGNSTIE